VLSKISALHCLEVKMPFLFDVIYFHQLRTNLPELFLLDRVNNHVASKKMPRFTNRGIFFNREAEQRDTTEAYGLTEAYFSTEKPSKAYFSSEKPSFAHSNLINHH